MFVSPANKNLRETLVRLNLCSDRDFRRSRRIVRKLARGIPAFDFVWIDALVQLGSLTLYQAKVLQSSPPESLCVGRYVLLERIGAGKNCETFRARGPDGRPVVLKRLRLPADESARAAAALGACLDQARGMESPFVVAPDSFVERDGALVLFSRLVSGATCKGLLVRRGRFPGEVVAEIARQVAHGCKALESRLLLHGQISLDNVKITDAGEAVLVDAVVGTALNQTVLIRDDVSPDEYDAIAPERIGTGNPITTASEIYAFGCLLWHLLAGRPPFPTNDPLAKLAAQQTRGVPDIRTIAPDVPVRLAEAVRACTRIDPAQRPASFAEIARRFGNPTPRSRQRLSRFVRRFDSAAPADQLTLEQPSRFPTTAVALALCVLLGATLFFFRHPAMKDPGRANSKIAAAFASQVEPSRAAADSSPEHVQSLPAPNAEGIIQLGEGRYEASTVKYVGDLLIRGTGRRPATIVVADRPLEIGCRKFTLERVKVRASSPRSLAALVTIRSQELAISGCSFGSGERINHSTGARDCAIAWTAMPARDPDAGRIRVTNTVFDTGRTALKFAAAPSRIELDNCLALGGGLLDLNAPSAQREVIVFAQHLTLRQSAFLCHVSRLASARSGGPLRLVLHDSAFDLAGRGAALVQLVSATEPAAGRSVIVTGRESVIRPDIPVIAWSKPGEEAARPIDSRGLVVEGLAVGDFQFVGPTGELAASAIDRQSLAIPRQSDEPPGVIPQRLASEVRSVTLEAN